MMARMATENNTTKNTDECVSITIDLSNSINTTQIINLYIRGAYIDDI